MASVNYFDLCYVMPGHGLGEMVTLQEFARDFARDFAKDFSETLRETADVVRKRLEDRRCRAEAVGRPL